MTLRSLTPEQARRLRLRAQHLDTSLHLPSGAAEVVHAVAGIQAQDAHAAEAGVWVRHPALTLGNFAQARADGRSVVRTWAMRGTLHLLATGDIGWMLPLVGPTFNRASRTRRCQLGLDDDVCEAAMRVLCDELADQGPLSRSEIVARMARRGITLVGQATPYLLAYAALAGGVCLGPEVRGNATYVLLDDWITPGPPLPRDVALGELARRYLAAFGPASLADFATWCKLPMPEVRFAWERVGPETVEVEVLGRPMRLLAEQADTPPATDAAPQVRLLPAFDSWLLAYRDRDLVIDPNHWRFINAGGGIINPTVLLDGRVIATWKATERRAHLDVAIQPFGDLPGIFWDLLPAEISAYASFRGKSVGTVARI